MVDVRFNKIRRFGDGTKVPAIPDVRSAKPEAVLTALKEWVEVREGARGASGLDRAVTVRDLLNTGTLTPSTIRGLIPHLEDIKPPPGTVDPDVPPPPTNLVAAGAVENIILTWSFARGYSRLAYFEVWRSDEDLLGTAAKIAQVFEPVYADNVGPGHKYYYWVRAVSDAGVSPYNSLSGTLGETAIDIEEVMDAVAGGINDSGLLDQLTIKTDADGLVTGYGPANTPSQDDGTNSVTFAILANRFLVAGPASGGVIPAPAFYVQTTPTTVNGVAVPAGVYLTDGFIQNGVITNAKIGNLAVDNAKIADVSVDKLTAGKLAVGEFIESTNYLAGDTGFHINGNGNAEFSNAVVRGTIYATAGLIGGNVIDETGVQSPGYTTATGWRINSDGQAYFNNIHVRGEFNAGAFTGYAWPPSGGTGAHLSANGLLLGNYYTGKYFQVTGDGNVLAPGFSITNGAASFSGHLTAASGNIGGNQIYPTYIQSPNFYSGYSGWRISSNGSAEFNGIVLSRPNIVRSGTYLVNRIVPTQVTDTSGEFPTTRPVTVDETIAEFLIDTGYDVYSDVGGANGPAFAARVLAVGGSDGWYAWWGGGTPASPWFDVYPTVGVGFYNTIGQTGAIWSGTYGRVFIRVRVAIDLFRANIYQIKIGYFRWELARVT